MEQWNSALRDLQNLWRRACLPCRPFLLCVSLHSVVSIHHFAICNTPELRVTWYHPNLVVLPVELPWLFTLFPPGRSSFCRALNHCFCLSYSSHLALYFSKFYSPVNFIVLHSLTQVSDTSWRQPVLFQYVRVLSELFGHGSQLRWSDWNSHISCSFLSFDAFSNKISHIVAIGPSSFSVL